MKVFFTGKNTEIEERNDVNCIDVITEKYLVRVRTSGVSIFKKGEVTDSIFDETLDLQ
jgi:hypothetical protein